jgi:hypothetical protein
MKDSENSSRTPLTILDAMVLIAGIAFGLWLFGNEFSQAGQEKWFILVVSVLGGLSLAGTPRILMDRLRGGRRWRSGALNWFAVGLACWALVPALVTLRLVGSKPSVAPTCFVYSLPLMGLFLLLATFIGGRPISRWWACRGWWPEWFGMWILVAWAGAGCYILFLIYRDMF